MQCTKVDWATPSSIGFQLGWVTFVSDTHKSLKYSCKFWPGLSEFWEPPWEGCVLATLISFGLGSRGACGETWNLPDFWHQVWFAHKPTLECPNTAAAKLLQSCLTLCDSIDGSPPGSPVPGILQARTLEWVAISFSKAWMWKVKVKSLSHIWLLATPWTAAHQAPPSMGFSRQEYWSEVPLPSPGPTLTNTNCCWSWSSNTLATWCKELTHWKRSWCWERLRAGGEGGGRGWDGWMASKTQWPWVWANYRRQWRTGKPEVLQSTGLQRDRHDWATEQQNPWMTPPPWM